MRQAQEHRGEAEQRERAEYDKRHAVAKSVGDHTPGKGAEHDARHHGRLKNAHRPGELLFRRDIHHERHAHDDEAPCRALKDAEQEKLHGRFHKRIGKDDQRQQEENQRERPFLPVPVCLQRPERRGERHEERRRPGNEPRPESGLAGIGHAQLRREKERNKRHHADDGDACSHLDGPHDID